MIRLFCVVLLLTGCEAKKEDPAIDVCQVNIDCILVQQDECCARSSCDEDYRAETNARTRARLDLCARKDCEKKPGACKSTGAKVASFCRDGKCRVERVP